MLEASSSLLLCKLCNQSLQNPIFLPCHSTICEKHVNDYFADGVKRKLCPICEDVHEMPKNGFLKNEYAEVLLKAEISEKHQIAKASINQLSVSVDTIKKLIDNPDSFIQDYVQRIRFEIDEKVEVEIKAIHDQRDDFLGKLAHFEQDCKLKAKELGKANISNETIEKIITQFEEWNKKVNFILLKDNTSEQIKIDSAKAISELELEITKSKRFLLQDAECHFKPFPLSNIGIITIKKMSNYEGLMPFLSTELSTSFIELTGFKATDEFALLYQGSKHGFKSTDFHAKCNHIPNTLTIIKTTNGSVFGGFTDEAWDSTSKCVNDIKHDSNSFLFSLVNKENTSAIFKLKPGKNIIVCDKTYGPTFGGDRNNLSDLFICNDANIFANSLSNLGFSYKTDLNTAEAKIFLAGSFHFQVTDMAVFQLKNI